MSERALIHARRATIRAEAVDGDGSTSVPRPPIVTSMSGDQRSLEEPTLGAR
jgi:hypothetical protein